MKIESVKTTNLIFTEEEMRALRIVSDLMDDLEEIADEYSIIELMDRDYEADEIRNFHYFILDLKDKLENDYRLTLHDET